MAGELGAADGGQTLHGHHRRVQGRWGRAQVRAARLGMPGKGWDLAWMISVFGPEQFSLCPPLLRVLHGCSATRVLPGETEDFRKPWRIP